MDLVAFDGLGEDDAGWSWPDDLFLGVVEILFGSESF